LQAGSLPDEARMRFAQDRFDAVRTIARTARHEACAFVVVAGDVFHSNHVDRRVVARAIEALASFTVPVFLLPGNHDPLDPSSVFRSDAWLKHRPPDVVVLEDAASQQVDGVEVIGMPWRDKHPLEDPIAACYAVPLSSPETLRVVVGHGVIDELSPQTDDPSLVSAGRMRTALRDRQAHYIALGDRHSVTEIDGTEGRARYSGTPVSTDYGEIDPNQVLLVSLDQDRCAVQSRVVGDWRFERTTREMGGEQDVLLLSKWLEEMPSKHTTVLKLALRGSLSLAESAALEDVLERNRMTFASLNTWERQADLAIVPDEADLEALDVAGYAREALEELRIRAAGTDDDTGVARDALNLLYRLAR
jgi:DNA repair exonuclease SbcCD nuclease subunit